MSDEKLSQLVGLLHGTAQRPERRRLRGRLYSLHGGPSNTMVGVEIDLAAEILRFVRGFHAALYEEFLPGDTRCAVHPPMPGFLQTPRGVVFDPIFPQQPMIVDLIKKNRAAGRLDRVECYNGNCLYHCVWIRFDDGGWGCVYGINIYNWKRLGSRKRPTRGCVGAYRPASGMPASASRFAEIEVSYSNLDPMDAFSS